MKRRGKKPDVFLGSRPQGRLPGKGDQTGPFPTRAECGVGRRRRSTPTQSPIAALGYTVRKRTEMPHTPGRPGGNRCFVVCARGIAHKNSFP